MNPFTIPNLPTDNLYKFYAITGVSISLFSFVFVILCYLNLINDIDNLNARTEILTLEAIFLKEDIKEYKNLKVELTEEYKSYEFPPADSIGNKYELRKFQLEKLRTDSSYRDYLKFLEDYESQVFPILKTAKELLELGENIISAKRKYELKDSELQYKREKSKKKLLELVLIYIIGVIALFYGYKLARKGFRLWKINVQEIIDEKLKLELEILQLKIKTKI